MKESKKGRNYYPLFNQKGKPSFYLDHDRINIYSWAGEPTAFVERGAVFTFGGEHLGWLEDGWLRDRDGTCVAFAEAGKGGPNPPRAKHPAAPPAEKKEPPEQPKIEKLPDRPARKPVWSSLADVDFFKR